MAKKPPLDLAEFEWKVNVRPMAIDDYEQVGELQKRCFPGMPTWMREQIQSQLDLFPDGQLVVDVDGEVVASSGSLILQYEPSLEWHNWKKVSDNGFIRNHNPKGDTLYGIEIMVDPEYRGMKLSRRLYEARKELCRQRNLARIIIAGRIPGYHKHADEMTAREYIDRVMNSELFDPVLTAQLSNGFALQGLIPNYLPSDADSKGYATFLEWNNLDYTPGKSRRYHLAIEPIRLCVVQYEMRPVRDFDEFAQQCEFFLDVA
ncbi:MAG: GNAT family N-acetyltransferase, partial [Gemmataceae bacterium]